MSQVKDAFHEAFVIQEACRSSDGRATENQLPDRMKRGEPGRGRVRTHQILEMWPCLRVQVYARWKSTCRSGSFHSFVETTQFITIQLHLYTVEPGLPRMVCYAFRVSWRTWVGETVGHHRPLVARLHAGCCTRSVRPGSQEGCFSREDRPEIHGFCF